MTEMGRGEKFHHLRPITKSSDFASAKAVCHLLGMAKLEELIQQVTQFLNERGNATETNTAWETFLQRFRKGPTTKLVPGESLTPETKQELESEEEEDPNWDENTDEKIQVLEEENRRLQIIHQESKTPKPNNRWLQTLQLENQRLRSLISQGNNTTQMTTPGPIYNHYAERKS